jgi:hypothetical protein
MNNSSLGWKIFGLFVSIGLIIGGFSGELVLRGTDSSEALVVVGFLFLIWDIVSIVTHKKQQVETEDMNSEADIALQAEADKYLVDANAAPLQENLSLVPEVHPICDEVNNQEATSLPVASTDLSKAVQSIPAAIAAMAQDDDRATDPRIGGYVKKPYFTLEHKVGSRYHNVGEHQMIVADQAEIGRDPTCEVCFDENFETVSRRHAAIIRDGSNWKLVPLSQTNPSFINGKMVQKEWFLQHSDEIQWAINGPKLVFRIGVSAL